MLKRAVLLYGRFPEKIDGKSILEIPECNPNNENNWMGWTKKELEEGGFEVHCPQVPLVWQAPYSSWKQELDKLTIDENTTLVGLSAGGGAATRYIVEEKKRIRKLILVAPAHFEPNPTTATFYDFVVGPEVKNQIIRGTTIFCDPKDFGFIVQSVEQYKHELDATVIDASGYGHFSFLIRTFPELLKEILANNDE